jgi:hypothetical protein
LCYVQAGEKLGKAKASSASELSPLGAKVSTGIPTSIKIRAGTNNVLIPHLYPHAAYGRRNVPVNERERRVSGVTEGAPPAPTPQTATPYSILPLPLMGMHLYQVRSVMDLVTADRPGLLVNVVRILKDISVNVVSAEADTIVRSPRRVLEVEGRRV